MKKFKFLILMLYLALMIIGVGYAYWSDSLIVNATVNTGELSVRFEEGELGGLKFPDLKASKYVLNKDIKIGNEDTILTDDNAATVNFQSLYPGAWAAFRLKAINSGTIPIKISDVDFGEFSGDTELLKYFTYEAGIGIDVDGNGTIDKHAKFEGNLKEIKDDFNKALNSESMKNVRINPNGGIYFYIPEEEAAPDLDNDNSADRFIIIKFDDDAPATTQNKTLSFKLTVNFKQFNAD